ncbi:MAG: MFS transporter, partial [Anaerolineae bacterium]|nr:MFS transporter [Anaerolineae bacterium]
MKNSQTPILILFASLFTVMLGFGIVIPLMPFFITHFGASASSLGLLMAIYSVMQFLFAPLWGRLSDRIGRKPVIMIGILGYVISFTMMSFATQLWMLIAARALAGMLSSATLPTAMAYVADITPAKDRSKGVGMLGAAMGLGMIFGPTLGGLMSGVQLPPAFQAVLQTTTDPASGRIINLSVPFLFAGLLALIALPVVHLALKESLTAEKRRILAAAASAHPAAPQPRMGSRIAGALRGESGFLFLMAFLFAFSLAMLESVLGLYGKQSFQMSPADIGLLLGAMGMMGVLMQGVLIGPLTRRFGEANVLKAGLGISLLGFIGLGLLRAEWGMIASALVFNMGSTLLNPSVTALISQRSRAAEQGAAMGLSNSFQSLGRSIGPIWSGFAFDIFPTLS